MAKIVQLSDCHLFKDKNKSGYNNINPYQTLKLLLLRVEQLNPDGIIVTGDISGDDSEQSYLHFLDLMEQFNLSHNLKVIAGNHDQTGLFDSLLGQFDLAKGQPWRQDNWVIHGLDTRHQGTLGQVGAADLQSLINKLQNHPDDFHMIVCHHHPIECGGWMDKHEWLNRHQFVHQIKQLPQVKLVAYGHIHNDIQQNLHGCCFQSSPSTCWQFANMADFALSEEMPGFKVYQLHNDGTFDNQTIRLQQEQLG
ncbi:metallophosphoesterase family protein [Aliiglaciecola lipolytica]|uniref:metallophosphoesterase family protein n=1 Tax=Aliiglaciecola lipolytica TaxID=477689 RepID=UPI001C08B8B3|nr:metallophosphoesterase [Aliiglaciecola lipolytica]MBU2878700.1 metallophosphoesterase [Aliiglaciecola lipolytica]